MQALFAKLIALSTLALSWSSCSRANDAEAVPRASDAKAASPSVVATTLSAVAATPSVRATKIAFSFKIDPRVLGATYGGEHWVSPQTYTGARGQDAVETMVRARGMRLAADPEWSVSAPDLVSVSPQRGKRVTITAKRAGSSTVTVKAGAATKTLSFKAEKHDGNWQLTASQ